VMDCNASPRLKPSDLVQRADGLTEDAFIGRAQ
jgi:hypothetical protein